MNGLPQRHRDHHLHVAGNERLPHTMGTVLAIRAHAMVAAALLVTVAALLMILTGVVTVPVGVHLRPGAATAPPRMASEQF